MYIHNERTLSVKKIRKRLENNKDSKVSYEINKILQWLLKNKYIIKLKSLSKSPNRYKILDNFNERKKELELFYKK